MRHLLRSIAMFGCSLWASAALADARPFDLDGPVLRVNVVRHGESLPIAEVPQLAAGDRISVRADLPQDQSAHYLLVAAFLRGSTNPPPDPWFFKSEPWTKKGRDGLTLDVPADAQQVALFLAPETGGDFSTLRDAVKGQPGAFVRAAQELAQASLDRSRLDTYLLAVRKTVPGDPDRLTRITPLLARSLQIKVNSDCLTKMPSLQAPCLLQNQEALVLNDGHSNAITDALAGPGTDLALQLSATPQGGLGYYSPYIAAIRDVIGILSSLHTAKYQYIPALATLDGDRMKLVLNAPPSFHNPKSVLVTALPIVAPVHLPPLQIPDASPALCMHSAHPLLSMVGAPLIYATRYAHDLVLRVTLAGGRMIDLPATPDAEMGGLSIDMGSLPSAVSGPLNAQLHGIWGFEPFDGPSVTLQSGEGGWRLSSDSAPEAGAFVTLSGGSAACVSGIAVATGDDKTLPASWTSKGPNAIRVALPPEARTSQPMTLVVDGPDGSQPDRVILGQAKPPAHIEASVVARSVGIPAPSGALNIRPESDGEVPASASLTLSLRLEGGARWTGRERVELSVDHGGSPVALGGESGLTILDDRVAVASIQPGKLLGPSAFGDLRVRIVGNGASSDWIPVGTLVRLPTLTGLDCPPADAACHLSGDGLYLIESIAISRSFEKPVNVPAGYPAATLNVPKPVDGGLYIRLHDAPDLVNRLVVP